MEHIAQSLPSIVDQVDVLDVMRREGVWKGIQLCVMDLRSSLVKEVSILSHSSPQIIND